MTPKQTEFVDALFLIGLMVLILVDTGAFLWLLTTKQAEVNEAVLTVFSGFTTATVVGPLGAWIGYRYGSSAGSKAKDDTIGAMAQKAVE